jgi:hypothetical protein
VAHPLLKVKPLVGALAYVYGITVPKTYTACDLQLAVDRATFMQSVMASFRLSDAVRDALART